VDGPLASRHHIMQAAFLRLPTSAPRYRGCTGTEMTGRSRISIIETTQKMHRSRSPRGRGLKRRALRDLVSPLRLMPPGDPDGLPGRGRLGDCY
jgi:hypothetical protein